MTPDWDFTGFFELKLTKRKNKKKIFWQVGSTDYSDLYEVRKGKEKRKEKYLRTISNKEKQPHFHLRPEPPPLTLLIIRIMILHTPPHPTRLRRLRLHTNTPHSLLRRPDRFARLMLTVLISERVQRVEAVGPGTPIDPHVVAYWTEFNAVAVHFGAGAAPAA